ncbi:hypothetical protein [Klenkia taihuensis]|uniref:Peptidoglycan binding domain-containing protein n=1 Tax=Klenkia taihuensis TaxID=1225127 RepID=A0A1I1SG63_9ACTN|nr:hypothetical protein [Klenkia taihuensis]GHE13441.1 hypothetical protein GCM10011381_35720 [Klenkia taihuensis]SFD45436.1 hypothetical protein SAMN05661030_3398 [Klenkia taihuensis]
MDRDDLEPSDPTDEGRRGRLAAWTTLARRNRTLGVTALVAALALVAGLVLGRFVLVPDDAGAGTPEPGLVTAPVVLGQLSNDVTIRGEVAYADPVEVTVDTSTLSGPAVVTGQVPEVGTELGPLSVALELAGRPVIVLPGELPAYRTLRVGVSGPDVVQFKEAMRAVGLDAGDPASNLFDGTAAAAIGSLYAQAGYPAPAGDEGAAEAVAAAEEAVTSAQQGLTAAQAALTAAQAGPGPVEVRTADNAVASAQRALDAALATDPGDTATIGDLRDALALAQLQRQQLGAPRSATEERAAVAGAQQQVGQAQDALAQARQDALPALPAGEVLYLTQLPRRVDATELRRGAVLEGAAMTVSGATLGLSGTVAAADARLLTPGQTATFDLPGGGEQAATITAVTAGTDAEDRWTVELEPAPLTPEQITALQGANVRVQIPVGATEGDVLSVPLAALSAGPGGESRVEVVDGDPRDGDRAGTRLVTVDTGLAADGAVEVTPTGGELDEGDLVVVGR